MKKRILIEASGSLVTNWLIKAIKESGNIPIASDITPDSVGRFLADDFVLVPKSTEPNLWTQLEKALLDKKVDIVIPSLNETLLLWATQKSYLKNQYGIDIVISEKETIEICYDKYKTYQFFINHNISTPQTSLDKKYPLVKPRYGRGGQGVFITNEENINMEGIISQEVLSGQEYTVDCLVDHFGNPVYIVPRKRLLVKDGKSVNSIVSREEDINEIVYKVCQNLKFFGPINIQCFKTKEGLKFTEINPRVGGGMVLSLAATENWVTLLVNYLSKGEKICGNREIKYGLRMYRYYEEVFV